VAGATTNIVFGFLRTYVLVAVALGAGGTASGYNHDQLITFVWIGQGVLTVVLFWRWSELADRIRTGDVATDLLRPVPAVFSYLATDLGRAGHAMITRFVPPVVVGSVVFGLSVPRHTATYPIFAASLVLAVIVSFGCRFLTNAAAYWLLDLRGVLAVWTVGSGVLSGLIFPLPFLPAWLVTALRYGTPFPSMFQNPLDILTERVDPAGQIKLLGVQIAWAVGTLALCEVVQRRAERKLVIQGG
jgi:ABC-2 type transport system permease protein